MTEFAVRGEGDLSEKSAGPTGLVQKVAHSPLRWVIAVVLLVSVVTGFFDRISVAVLFTDRGFNAAMGTNFHPAALGMLMTAFLLAYALSALFLSFGGDLFGPRRTLGFASGVWGLLMFLMGACGSYGGMIFYRVLLGLSEGPQFSLISKAVQRWFPRHEQTRANALWMVGSPIGSAIGFPLTIWLVSNYGWRASFYVLGAFNLVLVMPLILGVVKDNPPAAGDASVEAVRGSIRLVDIRLLLADKKVWMLAAFGAGLLTYLWGLNSWLPTYLQRVRHFDLHHMGLFSALPFILMFFAEIISGYVADRSGKYALVSSAGLLAAGVLMYIATQVTQPQLAALIIALSAAAWGFGIPSQYALALRVFPAGSTATGIGIINGIGNLVGACAPAVIGFIVAATGSFQAGLLVIVIASVLGSLALLPMVNFKPAA
jgi:sugar phosphate permease